MTLADKSSSSFRSLSRGFFDHFSSNSNLGFGRAKGGSVIIAACNPAGGKTGWEREKELVGKREGGSRSVQAVDR